MNNSDKLILDLCGGTGSWAKPYKDAGYNVKTITIPEYDIVKWKQYQDIYDPIMNNRVYGILAAPPCTMFSFARFLSEEVKISDFPEDVFGDLPIEKKSGNSKTTVFVARSQDRLTDRDELVRNLKQAGIKAEVREKSGQSVDPIHIDDGFDTKVIILIKPKSGGIGETTLNASITELFPAIAWEKNFNVGTNIEKFYDFLKPNDTFLWLRQHECPLATCASFLRLHCLPELFIRCGVHISSVGRHTRGIHTGARTVGFSRLDDILSQKLPTPLPPLFKFASPRESPQNKRDASKQTQARRSKQTVAVFLLFDSLTAVCFEAFVFFPTQKYKIYTSHLGSLDYHLGRDPSIKFQIKAFN